MNLKQPNNFKYRKTQRKIRHIRGENNRCCNLVYGEYGIRVLYGSFITAAQIETIRLVSLRTMRKSKMKLGEIRFRIFPYRGITQKAPQVRMGGGKADLHHWAAPVKSNTIICEFLFIDKNVAKLIFKQINVRLPGKITLVEKENNISEIPIAGKESEIKQ